MTFTPNRIRRLAAICILAVAAPAIAQELPLDADNDKYAVFWTNMFGHAVDLNLGPTGARGWAWKDKVYVSYVDPETPAVGKLWPGDVIIGAFGKPFDKTIEARIGLGNAITEAEAVGRGGKLDLLVYQNGVRRTVTVQLPMLGSYAKDWPFNCEKSARIVDQACAYLAARQLPNGHLPGDEEFSTPMAGILLLASGQAKYLDAARRAAYFVGDHPRMEGMMSWSWGYNAILMAEYYLATGDRGILPALKKQCVMLQDIQADCGSWCHGSPGGYGTVNATGLTCWMGLILASECGLKVDQAVLTRSRNMFQRFAGKGHVPYGDHSPYMSLTTAGNGKDAMAAINFRLLGMDDIAAKFTQTVTSSYRHLETGHTGCYLSFFWNSIAITHAGPAARRRLWDHWRWYYELIRMPHGGMTNQPYLAMAGEPGMKYRGLGADSTTGGAALFYALPRAKLRILGAPKSVFGPKAPKSLTKARALYDARKWDDLAAALKAFRPANADEKRMAGQLAAAAGTARESVRLTLATARSCASGSDSPRFNDIHRGATIVKMLERSIGRTPETKAAMAAINPDGKNDRWVKLGEEYHDLIKQIQTLSYQSWHFHGRMAYRTLGLRQPVATEFGWETILPMATADAPRTWQHHQFEDSGALAAARGWTDRDYNDSAWASGFAPVQPAPRGPKKDAKSIQWSKRHLLMRTTFTYDGGHRQFQLLLTTTNGDAVTMVYLNGRKIVNSLRRNSGANGHAIIPLSPKVAELIRAGENTLAVHVSGTQKGMVNLGLQAK